MRLDKFLAHNNFGTRKEVKDLIKSKRVSINNIIAKDSGRLLNLASDIVKVDNEVVNYTKDLYLMINKPSGYVCSHREDSYPSVLDLIDEQRKDLIMVGRLDADTEGLLFITNDGQFSHHVISGKHDIMKTYYVELKEIFDESFTTILEQGMPFENGFLKPAKVEVLSPKSINLSISEGKYHQVKRMMHACNNEVTYLKRIAIGSVVLDPKLNTGEYRTLTTDEIESFM